MKKIFNLAFILLFLACEPVPVPTPTDNCEADYKECGTAARNSYNNCYRMCSGPNSYAGCYDTCQRDYEIEVGECRNAKLDCES